MAGLCRTLESRLSHVSIVSLRSVEHARWFLDECARDLPVVHHLSGVAPADPKGPDLERYALLDEISVVLRARWSCEDIAIWSMGPFALPYFAPPILDREAADHAAAGVALMLERGSVPFLAENPSFTITAGELPLGEYFDHLCRSSGCGMVADVSHVYSYGLVVQRSALDVLASLPLDRVEELHVAGGRVSTESSRRYVDSHSDPVLDPVLELVSEAAARCPRLRAVTYELGMELPMAQIDHDLARIESILEARGWEPSLESSSIP